MSDTSDLIRNHLTGRKELARQQLPDLSHKVLVAVANGKFKVEHLRQHPAPDSQIIETNNVSLAARVYDSYDGERPWLPEYLPRGFNEIGRKTDRRVFAAGATIDGCIIGFADSLGFDEKAVTDVEIDLQQDCEQGGWGARFTCDGTSFKAAGGYVPGGVIMTWWK